MESRLISSRAPVPVCLLPDQNLIHYHWYPSSMPKRFSKRRKTRNPKLWQKWCVPWPHGSSAIFLWLHHCKGEVLLKKEVTILYMCTNTTSSHFSSNLRILHSNRHFHSPLGRWYETSPSSIEIQLKMTILSIIRFKLILMIPGKRIIEIFSRLFWC